ncbi:probable cation-transporting ATPase 13A4 [Python bivittatus]|uniref:Cation-transporting ATPase n=1 Tax=Python bivittatus TaxID=176946 RepID=A0A9F5IXD0_PYTBI|nr:probable cation-transporting ATPase 13A4 [Python bivittatus]
MGEKHGGNHWALLNQGEEAEMEIFGYKTQGVRRALCLAGYLLSCGGLLLLFHWKPEWDVWANCVPCSLEEADVVLLRTTDEFQIFTQKKVTWIPLSAQLSPSYLDMDDEGSLLNRIIVKPEFKVRSIQVQKIRYAWDFSAQEFRKVGVLEDSYSCVEIHTKFGTGLTTPEQELRREICGPNAIDIEVTPIWKLLVKEVLHPFYIFQLFSVCLWFAEGYIEYSVAIIIMSLLSVSLTVYDLRKQSVKLHQLVESHNSVLVKVCRKQTGIQEIESRHLVPGDTLILDEGKSLLSCDAILVSGQCVVNEGMLTGESVPITKTSLPCDSKSTQPWHLSSPEDSKRHLLFCGTDVIQARGEDSGPARAVVLRTGFSTAKGDLVRSILYPKPMNFRLYRDAMQFLLCLVAVAGIGMIYAVCVFVINGQEAGEVVKKALDVITIAVPPALPAALTTGIIYAQKRLKKKGIFCISPQRINVCGQLNLICFDKTGTLTEDGLDLWGVVLAEGKSFQEVHRFSSGRMMPWSPAYAAMASCHSLMVLDGEIQGDPLDLKMFEATHWEFVDSVGREGGPAYSVMVRPGSEAAEVPVEAMAVLRQFPFSSALQRMTVVAQELPGDCQVFMKGAPEMVASFCRPETVPPCFASELQGYTSQGFRVIALAHKRLQEGKAAASLTREEVESGLTFLGFLVMENRLKSETRPVLEELSRARIRSVMVTGDNLQTAITVARNAGMILRGSQVILAEAGAQPGQPSASVSWRVLEEVTLGGGSCAEVSGPVEGGQRCWCGWANLSVAAPPPSRPCQDLPWLGWGRTKRPGGRAPPEALASKKHGLLNAASLLSSTGEATSPREGRGRGEKSPPGMWPWEGLAPLRGIGSFGRCQFARGISAPAQSVPHGALSSQARAAFRPSSSTPNCDTPCFSPGVAPVGPLSAPLARPAWSLPPCPPHGSAPCEADSSLPQLLLNGTVFARMSPAQKAHLVQQFQQLDYYVGMCGDGANDCGALKEAHAGISLSEQDASVASPFTSKIPTIECVPELIRHGRAALVTSFCMFKYMAVFSLATYIGVLLLYWQLNSFGNYQFLFQDLAITTVIGMTMSLNGPYARLVPYRPPTQLIAPPLLLSVVLNLLFSLAVQVCGFLLVQQQLWYSPSDMHSACSAENTTHRGLPEPVNSSLGKSLNPGDRAPLPRDSFQSYENTSVWLLCTVNCLMVALVFSKGKPFREPVYKNYIFMAVLTVQLAVCLFFLFANIDELYAQMDLVCTPTLWRVWLLGLLLIAFVVSFTVEEVLIENRALWKLIKRRVGYQSSSRHKQLQRALEKDLAWPPRDRTDLLGSAAVHVEGPGATYSNPAFVSHEQPSQDS